MTDLGSEHAGDDAGSAVLNALPAMLWTTHEDGRTGFVTPGWRHYTGLDGPDAGARGWQATVHLDDLASVLAAFDRSRHTSAATRIDARLRRFDGEMRWFVIRLSPIDREHRPDRRWCWLALEADETVTTTEQPKPDGRLERFVDSLPTQVVFLTPALELEFVNRQVANFYGQSTDDLKHWSKSGAIHHEDLPEVQDRLTKLINHGEIYDAQHRMRRADGQYRWMRSRMVPSTDAQGNIVRYCAVHPDVHDLKRAEDLLAGEVRVLEMVARGKPLRDVLDALSQLVEALCAGCLCSILIVAPDRKHFQVGAGPSLPEAYNRILDGKTIDGGYGPCSLAIIEKATILTPDLANDPRWAGSAWLPLMQTCGYASCWSMPILSDAGEACGIFAIYRRDPVGPTPEEQQLIDRFTVIAGIAINRAHADQALQISEDKLRDANAHLTQAQRLSRTGSFTTDVHADKHVWSDELYRILEFEPSAEVKFLTFRSLVHPDDLAGFDARYRQARATRTDFDFVFRIVTPKGAEKHLHGVSHFVDADREHPVVMGSIQDVTEVKHAETALRARSEELRRALAQLSEGQSLSKTGSFTSDVQMDQHSWSDEFCRIFEIDRAERSRIGAVRERVHPDDLEAFDREIQGGTPGNTLDFSFRIVTPSGNLRTLRTLRRVARLIEHIDGRPIFMGTVQDITDGRLAEEALRTSEAELRRTNHYLMTAQRLSKTGSFTWDLSTGESRWSEEMSRIFEVDPRHIMDAFHPDDVAIVHTVRQRALDGLNFDFECRLLTPGGALKHVHIVGHRIGGAMENAPVFVGAAQDVTELKRGEEALNKARADLAHVSRVTTLSALTASVAHEVKQPLAGILINANTCLSMLGANPPNLAGAAETARRTIRDTSRATEVIARLRALFARKPPTVGPVDLNEAAREIIALSASELSRSRAVLRTAFASDVPAVRGDRVQLQQVILNLLLNAVDAMAGVEDRPRVVLVETSVHDDGLGRLSVRDAGVGVDPQTIEKMFSAFYSTKPGGMGVGLSVSRAIIDSHEGRLWASANDGPGATFSFVVPRAMRDERQETTSF